MSYAIFTVMYGVPLNSNGWGEDERTTEFEEFIDSDGPGLVTPYSGNGSVPPCGFGIVLDQFDEARHHIDLSTLTLAPTGQQLKQYEILLNEIPDEVREEFTKYGPPRVFFLTGSS